jgi:hypothetical protein
VQLVQVDQAEDHLVADMAKVNSALERVIHLS